MKNIIASFVVILTLALAIPAFATFPASATVANQAKVELGLGKIKLATDTLKMVLKTQAGASADTASIGSYSTTGELATSGGYTLGGVTLGSCTVTLSGSAANFTCSAASWTNTSALTFDAVEIYDSSCGTNSCTNANQVVALFPITSFTSSSSGTFTVTLPSNALSIAMDIMGIPQYAAADLTAAGADSVQLPACFAGANAH